MQQRLGHASISTTLGIYAHTDSDLQRGAADAMDYILARGQVGRLAMEFGCSSVAEPPITPAQRRRPVCNGPSTCAILVGHQGLEP